MMLLFFLLHKKIHFLEIKDSCTMLLVYLFRHPPQQLLNLLANFEYVEQRGRAHSGN